MKRLQNFVRPCRVESATYLEISNVSGDIIVHRLSEEIVGVYVFLDDTISSGKGMINAVTVNRDIHLYRFENKRVNVHAHKFSRVYHLTTPG